ncbi:hypothetical protein ACFLUR_02335 [Chloroflexota bacterium]
MKQNLFSVRIRKCSHYLVVYITITLFLSIFIGCSGKVEARLGEKFSLNVGESITITGGILGIKFIEVSEDSRCPKDVTCIRAGMVTAIVEISIDGSSQQLNLSQPGLSDVPSKRTYEGYQLTYRVEPYPEKAEVRISSDVYRLLIIINTAPKPIQTEADFTGFITEIHPLEKDDIFGQILVESHADKIADKYVVTVRDETLILQQDGNKMNQTDFEALETNQQVQIWFTGPIMESFP